MKFVKARVLVLLLVLTSGLLPTPAIADTLQLVVAKDAAPPYSRNYFKHWIDADKDGCDTRAEVLIEEAIIKPKIGPKCKLTGGKWISAYDGKTIINASQLDVDHLIPLAEAWRSGAWKWTAAERQAYANDLENSEALIAVSANVNRSKGDKDVANWKPKNNLCEYVKNWISVKSKYNLTVDSLEYSYLVNSSKECNLDSALLDISKVLNMPPTPIITNDYDENRSNPIVTIHIPAYTAVPGYKAVLRARYNSPFNSPELGACTFNSKTGPQFLNNQILEITPVTLYCLGYPNSKTEFSTFAYLEGTPYVSKSSQIVEMIIGTFSTTTPTPTPIPTPTAQDLIVTPGAFCSPAGAIGKSSSGVTYTCKSSSTDSRNRWRQ